MCTVTYIPGKNGFVLTSNRDEHISRGIAFYPDFYEIGNKKLVYPKDNKAGGTWFISNERGDAGVLLNGAFGKHRPLPFYRKSRGLVLPEIFQSDSPILAIQQYNLSEIESFTIILFEHGLLYEIKWDGFKLFIRNHHPQKAYIWSSVTLYSAQMIWERQGWLDNWLQSGKTNSQADILNFHSDTGSGNNEYGLKISRENKIATSSITSLKIDFQRVTFYHKDLVQNIDTILEYDLKQISADPASTICGSEIVSKN
jgi:hypothetical protein